MISKNQWDTNDKLKKNLMKKLNIQNNSHDPIDETTLRQILVEHDETTLRKVLKEMLNI
jgi:hypothetical protein